MFAGGALAQMYVRIAACISAIGGSGAVPTRFASWFSCCSWLSGSAAIGAVSGTDIDCEDKQRLIRRQNELVYLQNNPHMDLNMIAKVLIELGGWQGCHKCFDLSMSMIGR